MGPGSTLPTHLFAHPDRLWLLAALLPSALWAALGARRRARDWAGLGQSGRPPGDGAWGWFASMVLIALALAQPRWGRTPGLEPPPGHDLILVVDVSRSMGAEDAVPDRLGVAVESGVSLLKALGAEAGNRAGVVAFAGRGAVRCPLTAHLEAATDALRALRPGGVQPGGTDLGAALDQAILAFDAEDHADGKTVVIFSDGEDHVGSWEPEVDRLKAAGILVHCVAIGDPDRGHPLPRARQLGPSKQAREPEPETRRSDLAFESISRGTGGALVPLGLASADLGVLFRERIEPTARRRRADLRVAERVERFPAFVLPAIALGLAACWPGLARRRGRRLAYATLALAALAAGAGPPTETAAGLVASGRDHYQAGRFAESLRAFERAVELAPKAAVPRFDAASALFQLRRYPEAVGRYEEARALGDASLAIKVDYALGNAQFAQGDVAEALARYDACLATTLGGKALDAVRSDAAANREFAARQLKPPPERPGGDGPEPPGSRRKRPSPQPRGGDRGEGDPSGPPDRPSGPEGGPPGGPSPNNPGTRGAGGAGGGGQAPPEEGSPEARLNAALEDVREARNRRPPEPPPAGSKGSGKDW